MKRIRLKIVGKVQGVGFRSFVHKNASKFCIKGWVKNLSDGNVQAVLEGNEESINKLIDLCRKGPSGALVNDLKVNEESFGREFNDFRILV